MKQFVPPSGRDKFFRCDNPRETTLSLHKFNAHRRTPILGCCTIAGFGAVGVFSSDALDFPSTRFGSAEIGLALMFVPDAFCKIATELKGFRLSPEFAALLVRPVALPLLTALNS